MKCIRCNGSGEVEKDPRVIGPQTSPCPACDGNGQVPRYAETAPPTQTRAQLLERLANIHCCECEGDSLRTIVRLADILHAKGISL